MSFGPHSNISQPGMGRPAPQAFMSSFPAERHLPNPFVPVQDPQFDVLQWYPRFQSCVRYFLDHAQHEGTVQAMAAFVNIQLPCQKSQAPILSSRPTGLSSAMPAHSAQGAGKFTIPNQAVQTISLTPYIRRLVATGFDFPGVLHGFFGDDWVSGIGRLHEVERRNYLFAAKSSNWLDVKSQYDMPDGQSIPFLRAIQNVTEDEIVGAETNWSQWLAMQDWMLGPRNPDDVPADVKIEDI